LDKSTQWGQKMKNKTYIMYKICKNCNDKKLVDLPYGKPITKDTCKNVVCNNCGCKKGYFLE